MHKFKAGDLVTLSLHLEQNNRNPDWIADALDNQYMIVLRTVKQYVICKGKSSKEWSIERKYAIPYQKQKEEQKPSKVPRYYTLNMPHSNELTVNYSKLYAEEVIARTKLQHDAWLIMDQIAQALGITKRHSNVWWDMDDKSQKTLILEAIKKLKRKRGTKNDKARLV